MQVTKVGKHQVSVQSWAWSRCYSLSSSLACQLFFALKGTQGHVILMMWGSEGLQGAEVLAESEWYIWNCRGLKYHHLTLFPHCKHPVHITVKTMFANCRGFGESGQQQRGEWHCTWVSSAARADAVETVWGSKGFPCRSQHISVDGRSHFMAALWVIKPLLWRVGESGTPEVYYLPCAQ